MPGGGRLLPRCGAPGVGRSPTPDRPPLGREAGARHPLAEGPGDVGSWTRHQPHSALASCLCQLWGRHEGARGGRLLLPGRGASAGGPCPTPDCPSLGRVAGTRYPLAVGAGVVGVGSRHQPHITRSCELAFRVVGAAPGRAGGGRLLPWCGVSGVRALSHARLPVLGACGRGPLPTGCGCRGYGHGDPSSTLQNARLGAGFARCGGSTRAPEGGGGIRRWALSYARPPILGACDRGPLPTGCGCGGRRRWDPSRTPQRALLQAGFARFGGSTRAPRAMGGSCLGVGRPQVGPLPRPTARPLGVRPGPATHWLWVRGLLAWGAVTNPTSRALVSWLCALWGRHKSIRGGAPVALVWGVRGSGALPLPAARHWRVRPGPATRWLWVRGLWVWGPVINPTERALASWLCALWGRHEGARGGGASGVGRSPMPDQPSLGRAAGAHYLQAVGSGAVGVGTRHGSHSALYCKLALRALGAVRGRPGPGGALAWVYGVQGWVLSHARPPVLGACGQGLRPTCCGRGGCGRGKPSPTPQRALLGAGFARCGGGTRVPRGGRPLPWCGKSGFGRSSTPDRRPMKRAAGARPPLAVGAGDMGAWTRHQPHSLRFCELALRALGAA